MFIFIFRIKPKASFQSLFSVICTSASYWGKFYQACWKHEAVCTCCYCGYCRWELVMLHYLLLQMCCCVLLSINPRGNKPLCLFHCTRVSKIFCYEYHEKYVAQPRARHCCCWWWNSSVMIAVHPCSCSHPESLEVFPQHVLCSTIYFLFQIHKSCVRDRDVVILCRNYARKCIFHP